MAVNCRARSFSVYTSSGHSAYLGKFVMSYTSTQKLKTVCEAVGVVSGRRLSIQSEFDINICGGIRRLEEIRIMVLFMKPAPRQILVG